MKILKKQALKLSTVLLVLLSTGSGFSKQKWSGRSTDTPVSKIENASFAPSPEAILAKI